MRDHSFKPMKLQKKKTNKQANQNKNNLQKINTGERI